MNSWIRTTVAAVVALVMLAPASTIGATELADAELTPVTALSVAPNGATYLPEITFVRMPETSCTLSFSSRPATAANENAPCSEDTKGGGSEENPGTLWCRGWVGAPLVRRERKYGLGRRLDKLRRGAGDRRAGPFMIARTGNPVRLALATVLLALLCGAPSPVAAQDASAPDPGFGYSGLAWRFPPPSLGDAYPEVVLVRSCSPAALAGIKVGDKLVAVDGQDAKDAPVFGDSKPGTVHRVALRRGDEVLEITFQATTRPKKMPSAEECRANKDAG